MMQRIENELAKRIQDAGFKAITITMNVNNDHITITPCYYGQTAVSFDEIDYYLMSSEKLNLYGGEKLSDVAKTIVNYEKLLEEDAKALESLKAHIREYGENSDWDFVSDYHKDIFGHRPHVPASQVIAWAHSNSTESARFYR